MVKYDIAIAGAGPAGSVLAYLAANAGLRVLLIERSLFDRARIGETAPPELRAVLARVGLAHVLDATSRAAPAVVSVWGSPAPVERHHIFSPFGDGVHLDRRAFDEALAIAASRAGADLRIGKLARFNQLCGGGYMISLPGEQEVEARLAIIACGRASGVTGIRVTRCHLDDHIAVAARFVGMNREPRTLIEAIPGGWFYFASVPEEQAVAVLITKAGSVPSNRATRRRWWLEALARTDLIGRALANQPVPVCLSVYDARASYAQVSAGQNWLAIGDARLAPDPLTGQGIIWAVEDAALVDRLLRTSSHTNLTKVISHRTPIDVAHYQAQRQRTYAIERRFPRDPYWAQINPLETRLLSSGS